MRVVRRVRSGREVPVELWNSNRLLKPRDGSPGVGPESLNICISFMGNGINAGELNLYPSNNC